MGIPLALWLVHKPNKIKFIIESLVTMPLVLPPTVLGFYLLIFMGPTGWFGGFLDFFQITSWNFTFKGLVLGSVLYSLPFVVQPIKDSISAIDRKLFDSAKVLGLSNLEIIFKLVIPLALPGILTGTILGFAHTLGEFGVVLMIGGNIPGETKLISIAIYEHVEGMNYEKAHILSFGILVFSFVLISAANYFRTKRWYRQNYD